MRGRSHNRESIVVGVPQGFPDSAQPVPFAQRSHRGRHDASHMQQIQMLDGDRLGAEEGDALDLQEAMIQGVGESVCDPLRHHDAHQQWQQHPDIARDLHSNTFEQRI